MSINECAEPVGLVRQRFAGEECTEATDVAADA